MHKGFEIVNWQNQLILTELLPLIDVKSLFPFNILTMNVYVHVWVLSKFYISITLKTHEDNSFMFWLRNV